MSLQYHRASAVSAQVHPRSRHSHPSPRAAAPSPSCACGSLRRSCGPDSSRAASPRPPAHGPAGGALASSHYLTTILSHEPRPPPSSYPRNPAGIRTNKSLRTCPSTSDYACVYGTHNAHRLSSLICMSVARPISPCSRRACGWRKNPRWSSTAGRAGARSRRRPAPARRAGAAGNFAVPWYYLGISRTIAVAPSWL